MNPSSKTHGSKKCGSSVGTDYKLISSHPSLPENIPEDIKNRLSSGYN